MGCLQRLLKRTVLGEPLLLLLLLSLVMCLTFSLLSLHLHAFSFAVHRIGLLCMSVDLLAPTVLSLMHARYRAVVGVVHLVLVLNVHLLDMCGGAGWLSIRVRLQNLSCL